MKTTKKTTKTTTTTATVETVNPFATLLTNYNTDPTNATALTDLATAVAYSVLKKCIDTSQNKTLVAVRQSIARDLATLDRIASTSFSTSSLPSL